MYPHRFDPISLVAGLALLAIGMPSMLGGFDLWTIRWEWAAPLLAIAAGTALLVSGLRSRTAPDTQSSFPAEHESTVRDELALFGAPPVFGQAPKSGEPPKSEEH